MADDIQLAIASDHAGFEAKQTLMAAERDRNWIDLGPSNDNSVDYPDYADKVCEHVLKNPNTLGVLICGTGIGMSIRANRYPGIRAALCTTPEMAIAAREHNDANILVLGARTMSPDEILVIFIEYMQSEFLGDRHERRVQKLDSPVNL
tara:strand:+ start:579 stop:1025 length:447 start_codon:yes stop_codon:yes gene_type:complete